MNTKYLPRFALRDLLWLTVVAGLVIGRTLQHRKYLHLHSQYSDLVKEKESVTWSLDAIVDLIQERDGKVEIGDDFVSLYIVAKPWQSGPGWTAKTKK